MSDLETVSAEEAAQAFGVPVERVIWAVKRDTLYDPTGYVVGDSVRVLSWEIREPRRAMHARRLAPSVGTGL